MSDPRQSIGMLRSLTARLNAVSDEAAQTVREVENLLNDAQFGFAHVLIESGGGTDPEVNDRYTKYLEFDRIGSRFRIVVTTYVDINPEDVQSKPWTDCSRTERLDSLPYLPMLLESMAEEAEKKLARAMGGLAKAKAVLEALRAQG